MAELPASWNLTTKPNDKGTLDVMGKDDTGADYRVRITDHKELTERDVSEIAAADREKTTAKEFCQGLVNHSAQFKRDSEREFEDELFELAKPVVNAGMHRVSVGSTAAYRRGYEEAFN